MLEDLKEKSVKVGLKMNISKTKIMAHVVTLNRQTPTELVQNYIYHGRKITLENDHQTGKNDRRIAMEWVAYVKLKDIFKKRTNILETFDQCIFPVFSYGTETMILKKYTMQFTNAQRTMKRNTFRLKLKEIRRKTNRSEVKRK